MVRKREPEPLQLEGLLGKLEESAGHPVPELLAICEHGFACFQEPPTGVAIKIACMKVAAGAIPGRSLDVPELDGSTLPDSVQTTAAMMVATAHAVGAQVDDPNGDLALVYTTSAVHGMLQHPNAVVAPFVRYWGANRVADINKRHLDPDQMSPDLLAQVLGEARAVEEVLGRFDFRGFQFFPTTLHQWGSYRSLRTTESEKDRLNLVNAALKRRHNETSTGFMEDVAYDHILDDVDAVLRASAKKRPAIEAALTLYVRALGLPTTVTPIFRHPPVYPDLSKVDRFWLDLVPSEVIAGAIVVSGMPSDGTAEDTRRLLEGLFMTLPV